VIERLINEAKFDRSRIKLNHYQTSEEGSSYDSLGYQVMISL
jgi:hypothetical protein